MTATPSRLQPDQFTSLELLPGDRPILMFMRHSIREAEDDPRANFAVPLTEEGVALAREWGRIVGDRFDAAYSSRWPRCVDTAAAIIEGAGQDLAVVVEELLCEPGCFVTDMRVAGVAFARLGPLEFVNHQLAEEGVAGTRTPLEGTAGLLRWLRARQPAPGRVNLFITHDTILGTFVSELTGRAAISAADWPWMLEALYLWFDGPRVHWVWRADTGRRNLSDYRIS